MKQKVFLLLLIATLISPFKVTAATYTADITGVKVAPSSGTGGSKCTATNYYVGFYTAGYALQGIRVTFYNDKNEQVGNTVDVWNWGKAFYYTKNYSSLKDEDGFIYYSKKSNHSRYYYSRIDYSNGKKFEADGGTYYFYFDKTAASQIKYGSKNSVVSGPLFYSLQDASKKLMRDYLMDTNVMKRYMKIAKADGLLDIEVGDYVMVLEPVIQISACVRGTYAGAFTSTEVGKLWALKSIGINNTLKTVPGWLALSKTTKIAGVTYTQEAVTDKKGNPRLFLGNEFAGNTGVGISVINGKEVCEPNCKDPNTAYKIVYRTVDLTNPFLGIDGKKRTLTEESNWYGSESTIDAKIYSKTPLYSIKLTPATIKVIRNDNKNVKYTDIMAKYSATSKFKDSAFKKKFGL